MAGSFGDMIKKSTVLGERYLVLASRESESWECKDEKTGDGVLLTLLPLTLVDDAEFAEEIRKMVAAKRRIRHPGVAKTLGLVKDENQGRLFIVSELASGRSLQERLDGWRRSGRVVENDDVLPLARRIAEALDQAHSHGVVHGDIDAESVILLTDGTVKVANFGYDRLIEKHISGSSSDDEPLSSLILRDQYDFGVLIAEMYGVDAQMVDGQGWERLSASAQYALGRALSKDSTQRFASCADFVKALGAATPPLGTEGLRREAGKQSRGGSQDGNMKNASGLDGASLKGIDQDRANLHSGDFDAQPGVSGKVELSRLISAILVFLSVFGIVLYFCLRGD